MKKLFIFVFLLYFIPVFSQNLPVHQDLKSGVLQNGLTYYILKNTQPKSMVSFRLATKVGSILEEESERGLAHFVEHMAFNGSENFQKNELIHFLENTGTRFGPDLNAYTSFDETVYMLDLRSDNPEMIDKGLLIFEDWAGRLSFDEEEIDKERGVVIAELQGSLGAMERMNKEIYPVQFKGSNYSSRLPIGLQDVVENASYETIRNFYKKWYRPELMALIIVGDIDVDAMEKEVKKRFSFLKSPANAPERWSESLPLETGTEVKVVSDKEASRTIVRIMYRHRKKEIKTQKDYRDLIVRSLYNTLISGRLAEYTRRDDSPFSFATAGYGSSVGDIDNYTATAVTTSAQISDAVEALVLENRRIQLHGFTSGELQRAKAAYKTRLEKSLLEKDQNESSSLSRALVSKYLRNSPFLSPQQEHELGMKLVDEISLDDLNKVVKDWIRPDDWILTVMAPADDKNPLPTEADLKNTIERVKLSTPSPYIDVNVPERLLLQTPKRGRVVSEKFNMKTNVMEWELSNGARVYFRYSDQKSDELIFAAQSLGGTSLLSTPDILNSMLATDVVAKGGLGQYDANVLEKYLADKVIRLSPYLGLYNEGFNGSCSPRDLEAFLEMLYLYFHFPKYDDQAGAAALNQAKALRQNDMENPDYYFSYNANKIKSGDHPRFKMFTSDDLDDLDPFRSYKIFTERFKCANEWVFVFAGNANTKDLKFLVETYIGAIKRCDEDEEQPFYIRTEPDKSQLKHVFYKGEADKAIAEVNYQGELDYSTRVARIFRIAVDICNIKLRERIREDLGGVYGIRMFGSPDRFGNDYTVSFRYSTGPDKLEMLMEESLKVLDTLKLFGPQEIDIQKVKEQAFQTWRVESQRNRWWASTILGRVMADESYTEIMLEDLEAFWATVTADEIRDMLRIILDSDYSIKIMMFPEAYSN
jgi:zinc protease